MSVHLALSLARGAHRRVLARALRRPGSLATVLFGALCSKACARAQGYKGVHRAAQRALRERLVERLDVPERLEYLQSA
eukprot:2064676-Pyramimonas_sp.AAC.1